MTSAGSGNRTPSAPATIRNTWCTAGVECTTGPLGTGIATSVGMAMAGLWQAAIFNWPGYDLFNYNVYALAGTRRPARRRRAEDAFLSRLR